MSECGTYGGYQKHRKNGEPPCRACKDAKNAYRRNARQQMAQGLTDQRRVSRPDHRLRRYRIDGRYACRCGKQYPMSWPAAVDEHRRHLLTVPLKAATTEQESAARRARQIRQRTGVGREPDPTAGLTGPCCRAERRRYGNHWFCTADEGHDGDHIAGDGTWVKARWKDGTVSKYPDTSQAACAGVDPELFYPDEGNAHSVPIRTAKWLCGRCPVRLECLQWALDNDELYGVWGGRSAKERLEIRMGRAAAS